MSTKRDTEIELMCVLCARVCVCVRQSERCSNVSN